MLSARGVNASDREDVIQETAARLFVMWDDVDQTRPLWGLAATIALNLVRSEARKRKIHQEIALDATIERESNVDVEGVGLARLELTRVGRAMSHLKADHRDVLLREAMDEPADDNRSAAATKMLRMRARRRLHLLLETASVGVGLCCLRARRWFDQIAPATSGMVAAVALASTMVSAAPNAALGGALAAGPVLTRPDASTSRVIREVARAPRLEEMAPSSSDSGVVNTATDDGIESVRVPVGPTEVSAGGEASFNNVSLRVEEGQGIAGVCTSGLPVAPAPVQCRD
jgi:DNA-directed RNA polymerase specialized sigma24 family protein